MPDGPPPPAVNLAGAEAAQAERLRQLSAERAPEEDARETSTLKPEAVERVEPIDVPRVEPRRGARAWELRKRRKKDAGAPAPGTAADPDGRGASLDVKA